MRKRGGEKEVWIREWGGEGELDSERRRGIGREGGEKRCREGGKISTTS